MSFVTVDIQSVLPREAYRPNIDASYGVVSEHDRKLLTDLLDNEAERVGIFPVHTCDYIDGKLGFKIFHDQTDGLKAGRRQRLRVAFQEGDAGLVFPVLNLILSTVDEDDDEVVLNGISKCKI